MENTKKLFAARLKEFRNGAEKDGFWRGLGLNAAKMGRYENEKEAPSIAKIVEICEKTKLSPNWLLMGLAPRSIDPTTSDKVGKGRDEKRMVKHAETKAKNRLPPVNIMVTKLEKPRIYH